MTSVFMEGGFWAGTQGGGLNKFNRENSTFIHYRSNASDANSLSNDYIFSILEDDAARSTEFQFPFRLLDDPFHFLDPPAQLAGFFFTFQTGYRLV